MQKCLAHIPLTLEQIIACQCVLMNPEDVTDFRRREGKLKFSFIYFNFELLAAKFHVNMSCAFFVVNVRISNGDLHARIRRVKIKNLSYS